MTSELESAGYRAQLAGTVSTLWPELSARLGDQLGAFVDAAAGSAASHGITPAVAMARFVNLCCAFGPSFERRPENEWALAILADERMDTWVKLHQLVVQGAAALKRRVSDGRATSDQLLRADGALLDGLDASSRANDSDAVPLARLACDLEAVDIRVLEVEWRREYLKRDGVWQMLALAEQPVSIRMGLERPSPELVCVLTHAPNRGPTARLQVRLLTHAVCDQDRHPAVTFAGEHGLWTWSGHQARAVSWLVDALPPAAADNGLGVVLLEETQPRTSLLRASTCGLRDTGRPAGSLETFVWAYPADQWLFAWQRETASQRHWPRSAQEAGEPAPPTRCRIERDGTAVPSALWAQAFHDTLDRALAQGLDGLFSAWSASAADCTMQASATMLAGRALLTWGWREGPQGLAGRPLMRFLSEFDGVNAIDLVLAGEVVLGATRTRVRLVVQGTAPMQQTLARESLAPGLFDTILPAAVRWRFDYRIEFDPVAVEEAAVWSEAGACTGALVGEAGLRPRTAGGGGWQWFARLETEAVSVPICLYDPVLGQTRRTLTLLPATRLLDWSLG